MDEEDWCVWLFDRTTTSRADMEEYIPEFISTAHASASFAGAKQMCCIPPKLTCGDVETWKMPGRGNERGNENPPVLWSL